MNMLLKELCTHSDCPLLINVYSEVITSDTVVVSPDRQLEASINAVETTLTAVKYEEVTARFDTSAKEEFFGNSYLYAAPLILCKLFVKSLGILN